MTRSHTIGRRSGAAPAPTAGRTDRERSAVYAAEQRVADLLQQAGGDFPVERRFGDYIAVQRYCDRVVDDPAVAAAVGKLPPVVVRSRRGSTKAHYERASATIAIPDTANWACREFVVLHELTHHAVAAGPYGRDPGHGPLFRALRVRLLGRVLGEQVATAMAASYSGAGLALMELPTLCAPPDPEARMITRISALLAKAESTGHGPEAEAYLAKAQELARAQALDLTTLQQADRGDSAPMRRQLLIGEARRLHTRYLLRLFVGIARANDVRCDVARDSTYAIAFGYPADIDLAERVFSTASVQMTTAAHAYLRSGAWRGTRYVRAASGDDGAVTATHNARSARVSFYAGFVDRVLQRIRDDNHSARIRLRAQASAAPAAPGRAGPGTPAVADPGDGDDRALLLARKQARVESFYRETSRARGTARSQDGVLFGGAAQAAGRAAADRVPGTRTGRIAAPHALPSGV